MTIAMKPEPNATESDIFLRKGFVQKYPVHFVLFPTNVFHLEVDEGARLFFEDESR